MKKAERERVEAEGKVYVDPLVRIGSRSDRIGRIALLYWLHLFHLRSLSDCLRQQRKAEL